MPYKKPEPDMKAIAKRWLAGWIWRAAPKRTIQCRLCPTLIPGGTKVYRYITGFRGETPQLAFACNECGQELVEFMIERLQKLLPEEDEECSKKAGSPTP
jgi:RNase P subunit RPR2